MAVVVLEALVPCQGLGSPAALEELYCMIQTKSITTMNINLQDFNISKYIDYTPQYFLAAQLYSITHCIISEVILLQHGII